VRQRKFLATLLSFTILLACYSFSPAFQAKTEKTSGTDAKFVMKASESDLAEITLAKLASQQGASPAVQRFAKKMIQDHSESSKELAKLAKQLGYPMAKDVSKHHQELCDKLSKMKGGDFDQAYMTGQLKAHQMAIKLFQDEAKQGQDENIKAFAMKFLPVIQDHYKMAQEIAKEAGSAK